MSPEAEEPGVGAFEIVLTGVGSNLVRVPSVVDANWVGAKYPCKPVMGYAGIVNCESHTMEGTRFDERHVRMLTTRHRIR